MPTLDLRSELRPDCGRCLGLCCVALPFAASADFAVDKPAGRPCAHLRTDSACDIHGQLRERGFAGCTVFDCLGAGQRVSQSTFAGRDWRTDTGTAQAMFAVFPVVRVLHELLWYLSEAATLPAARPVHAELEAALTRVERLAQGTPEELAGLDVGPVRDDVAALLRRASELARAEVPGRRRDARGADLVGARMCNADLRGADLRGALLVAADLRRADLRRADLIGADLRNADLGDADLDGALFVTQAQLDAARGNAATRLPAGLRRPAHW